MMHTMRVRTWCLLQERGDALLDSGAALTAAWRHFHAVLPQLGGGIRCATRHSEQQHVARQRARHQLLELTLVAAGRASDCVDVVVVASTIVGSCQTFAREHLSDTHVSSARVKSNAIMNLACFSSLAYSIVCIAVAGIKLGIGIVIGTLVIIVIVPCSCG
jgi:hypothetical protein